MAIAVAILVAVLAGAVAVYFFYLRKPAKQVVSPPVIPQAAPAPQDEVEITEEELASLKELPALKKELTQIKSLLQRLEGEVEPEPEPEPPPEEWEEIELKPGLILKTRKNGHAPPVAEVPPPAPKETPAERMARARAVAAKNREAKRQVQEGP